MSACEPAALPVLNTFVHFGDLEQPDIRRSKTAPPIGSAQAECDPEGFDAQQGIDEEVAQEPFEGSSVEIGVPSPHDSPTRSGCDISETSSNTGGKKIRLEGRIMGGHCDGSSSGVARAACMNSQAVLGAPCTQPGDCAQGVFFWVPLHQLSSCISGCRHSPSGLAASPCISEHASKSDLAQLSAGDASHDQEPVWPVKSPTKGAPETGVRGQRAWKEKSSSERTTVMLRNLPSSYSRSTLLALLDSEGLAGKYDFVYLPIDFRTHASLGYAFVNFASPEDAEDCLRRLHGFSKWAGGKACSATWSCPHQGLAAHVARYRNSPLMHKVVPDEYRPVLLKDGLRIEFPPPTKKIKCPRQGTEKMLTAAARGGA